jgi:hypothetical protein
MVGKRHGKIRLESYYMEDNIKMDHTGIAYEDVTWNCPSIVADVTLMNFHLFDRSEACCSVLFPTQYTVLIL